MLPVTDRCEMSVHVLVLVTNYALTNKTKDEHFLNYQPITFSANIGKSVNV